MSIKKRSKRPLWSCCGREFGRYRAYRGAREAHTMNPSIIHIKRGASTTTARLALPHTGLSTSSRAVVDFDSIWGLNSRCCDGGVELLRRPVVVRKYRTPWWTEHVSAFQRRRPRRLPASLGPLRSRAARILRAHPRPQSPGRGAVSRASLDTDAPLASEPRPCVQRNSLVSQSS